MVQAKMERGRWSNGVLRRAEDSDGIRLLRLILIGNIFNLRSDIGAPSCTEDKEGEQHTARYHLPR
jgi:hypothetical protein